MSTQCEECKKQEHETFKMNDATAKTVSATLEVLAGHCHEMARSKGFWDNRYSALKKHVPRDSAISDGEMGENVSVHELLKVLNNRNDGELLMLIVSELAEALKGLLHGNGPSEHIPEYSCLEEELADTTIRIMDMAAARNCRIGEAVIAKMKYNATRPHKHGKKF